MTTVHSNDDMERVYDLLNQANMETDLDKILALANEVLAIDENNLDAKALIVSGYDDLLRQKVEYEELISQEGERLENDEGILLEIGEFYTIFETRPYIRLRANYCDVLRSLEMNRLAMQEAEEIIMLNKNDNLGMRYFLYMLYAKLEERDRAEKLYKKYEEDLLEVNLPLSLLYFKVGELTLARQYLEKAHDNNESFYSFLNDEIDLEGMDVEDEYAVGTLGEFVYLLSHGGEILFDNMPYLDWAQAELDRYITSKD